MEPRFPLVQQTFGGPHLWMSREAEGGRDTTRLMLACRYPYMKSLALATLSVFPCVELPVASILCKPPLT
jgi:hypothetical protein